MSNAPGTSRTNIILSYEMRGSRPGSQGLGDTTVPSSALDASSLCIFVADGTCHLKGVSLRSVRLD